MFLTTNDGRINGRYVISIGKPEKWPHGVFHEVLYRVGTEAWKTRATEDDVQDFLDSEEPT